MVNWSMEKVNPDIDANLNANSSPSGEVGRGLLTLTYGGRCGVIAFFEH